MKTSKFKTSILFTLFSLLLTAQNTDLKVSNNSKLYISPSSIVYVSDNSTIESGGELIMDSTSDNFSDFFVVGTSAGIAEYRHFTASIGTRDLVSPPVSGEAFSDFAQNNSGKIPTGTLTGSPNLLYGPFNNMTSSYEEYAPSETTIMQPSNGFRAASVNGETLSYNGLVSTGDVLLNITYGTGQFKRNNLIGNPFTTHLDSQDLMGVISTTGGIDSNFKAIYFYDGSTNSFPWKVINNTTSSELITPGQGFMLMASDTGSAFSIPKSARRVSLTQQDNAIQGRLANNSSSFNLKLTKQSLMYTAKIYFTNDGLVTRGLDAGWDAGNIGSHVGTHLVEDSEGVNFSIQALDISDLTATDYMIPVDVSLAAGEEAMFSTIDLNIPAGVNFYLDDTELNVQTLITSNSYTFAATTELNGIGRFYLRTTSDTFSAASTALNSVEIFTIAETNELTVRGQLRSASVLKLHDIRGRLINSYHLDPNQTEHKIDVSAVSPGVYIVNLSNEFQAKTTKLVIN
tara:strand:+ start:3907 stop:5451 length:1545 start_codon:yes stop_codon:yes gene_type:complete